jgi:3D-(3,5/4)-trihydroxycyclohexane-1,2-dione acylhydrolase (decyclizing)
LLLIDNHGYQCIRALQLGKAGIDFGNEMRSRQDGALAGPYVPMDYARNIESFGVRTFEADDVETLRQALRAARQVSGPAAIVCHVEPHRGLVGSDTWWDVGVAQASQRAQTREIAAQHLAGAMCQRFLG